MAGQELKTRSLGQAIWYGIFYAISAFNNAGFGLRSDSLMGFVGEAGIIAPICAAIIIGGIGFPVLVELWGRVRGSREPLSITRSLRWRALLFCWW